MTNPKETQSSKLDKLASDVASLTFDNERVIKPAIKEIKEMVERLPNGFATKDDIRDHDKRITVLEKARAKNWVFNTASAGVGALLFFLVQYALTH
jgi:hypothetical protein